MTRDTRMHEIKTEVRYATVDKIAALDASEADRQEIAKVFLALQKAVNADTKDKAPKARTVSTALSLAIEEIDRIYHRLADEKLSSDPD